MIAIVEKWLDNCLPAVEATPVSGGAMLPSEMLLFISLCREQSVDLIIESGRKNGFSTEVLCRAGEWQVHSIEKAVVPEADRRLGELFGERLTLHRGDGKVLVPSLIDGSKRTAILLDGPKNLDGCRVFEAVRDSIVFAGVHDVAKRNCSDTSQPNEGRIVAERLDAAAYFSDAPDYLERFGHLDRRWMDGNPDPAGRYTSHSTFIGVTCVLGILHGGKWCDL